MRLSLWHVAAPARYVARTVRERVYDERHGVDTRGTARLHDTSAHNDACEYAGAEPRHFRSIVRPLPIAPATLTFVDVGCGKGRALLFAAAAGFENLVGIELVPELAMVARSNLQACGIQAEIVEGDAATFQFADEPLFVFLFNPFGETTLHVVMDSLRASYARLPRPIFLGYQNPIHRDCILASGFLAPVAEGRHWSLFGTAG